MSGFVCGMRRFDKHKTIVVSKPSQNSEMDKRLQEMIAIRNQQDKGVFTPLPAHHTILPQINK